MQLLALGGKLQVDLGLLEVDLLILVEIDRERSQLGHTQKEIDALRSAHNRTTKNAQETALACATHQIDQLRKRIGELEITLATNCSECYQFQRRRMQEESSPRSSVRRRGALCNKAGPFGPIADGPFG